MIIYAFYIDYSTTHYLCLKSINIFIDLPQVFKKYLSINRYEYLNHLYFLFSLFSFFHKQSISFYLKLQNFN